MKDKYQHVFSRISESGYEIKHSSMIENKLNLVVKVRDMSEKKKAVNLIEKINDQVSGDIDFHIIY